MVTFRQYTRRPVPSMTTLSRMGLRKVCAAGLPGLLHFGGMAPLVIPVGARIRALRLFLPEEEILSLAALQLERDQAGPLPAHRVTLSSSREPDADPAGLLDGRSVHTRKERLPSWQVHFAAPVAVRHLLVRNRSDMWASRGYGLCAEWEREDGATLGFDNLAVPLLRARLGALRVRLDAALAEDVDGPNDRLALVGALTGLCGHVGAAIETALGDPQTLGRHRANVLARAAATLARAPREELLRLVPLAPVLDSLVWRGPGEAGAPVAEETALAAFVLAVALKEQGTVDLRQVMELQRLIPAASDVAGLETLIDEFVQRMDLEPSSLPVRLLPHGLRRSDWASNEQAYVAALREVLGLLAGLGYPGAIGYGTLLGAVRDGRLIAHDDDVDMMVATRARDERELDGELAALVERLRAMGVRASITPGFQFLKVTAPGAGRPVDVFPIITASGDSVRLYLRNMRFHDLPRSAILPFATLPFYGQAIGVPRAPELFLEKHFGADWRIPNRFSRLHWIAVGGPGRSAAAAPLSVQDLAQAS